MYVFDLDGLFICRAEDPELTGVSLRELALARKARQKAVIGEKVKEAKRIVREQKPQESVALILDHKSRQAEAKRAARAAASASAEPEAHTTPALDQAAIAAMAAGPAQPSPMTAAEAADRARLERDWVLNNIPKVRNIGPDDLASKEAFVTSQLLLQRQEEGDRLSPAEVKWLLGYQSTVYCKIHHEMLADFGAAAFDGIEAFAIP